MGLLLVGCGKKSSKPETKAKSLSTSHAKEAHNNQSKTDPTPKLEKENAAPPKDAPKVEVKKPEPPKTTVTKLIIDPIAEKAIRKELRKPTGGLGESDRDGSRSQRTDRFEGSGETHAPRKSGSQIQ